MLKHTFSDFSYAVNIESAKKGQKEILVCYIYNGIEVLKKIYIPESPGTSYIFEAKKIIDQEMRDGSLAVYSHKFIAKNKRKRIQPKKVVAAVNAGKPANSVAPSTVANAPTPKGGIGKWVAITAVVAILVAAGSALITYFATKNNEPEPTPTTDECDVVFMTDEFIHHESDSDRVKVNAPYEFTLSIVEGKTNSYEIDQEKFTIYTGKTLLEKDNDYDITECEDELTGTNWLEISIHENKIKNTVFINAKSIERSSVGTFDYDVVENKAIITDLILKAGQNRADITEITIPNYIDGYEVTGIQIKTTDIDPDSKYNPGDGLLTGCSSLRKLSVPFVGLNKKVTISWDDPECKSHLLGALFGENAFKNAETTTYQDYYYMVENDDPETKTEKPFVEKHVYKEASIPNTLREITVTGYNDVTYEEKSEQGVETTREVISIPMGAFSNCVYLTNVEIVTSNSNDDGDNSLDRRSFSGCRALNSFTYSDKQTPLIIEKNAFDGCAILSSFDFKAVVTIKAQAFLSCGGMVSVYLPSDITTIESGAFEGYYGLIKCEDSKETVEGKWNKGWADSFAPVIYNAEEDTAPITDTSGNYSCIITEKPETNAKSVYIVQYLGPYGDAYPEIEIPGTLDFSTDTVEIEDAPVEYIGAESFMDFNKTVTIDVNCPNLVSIESEAFKKCLKLTEIDFTNCTSLQNIGSNAFENSPKLTSVKGLSIDTVTSIGDYAFYDCPILATDFNLPKVTKVGASAFENDVTLTSITLNQSTTDCVTFGAGAFKNCSELKTIDYKTKTTAAEGEEYEIPDYCFYGTKIKNIIIPQITNRVGVAAYAYCQTAETISFSGTDNSHDGNKTTVIGDSAFLRCTHINYVNGAETETETYIPKGVISIGRNAFQDCFHLYGITCKGSKFKEIPDSMCYGTSNLNHFVYIDDPSDPDDASYTNIGQFAFAQDQGLIYIGARTSTNPIKSDNKLPKTLSGIGDRAFINCVSLGIKYRSSGVDRFDYTALVIQHDGKATEFTMGEQVFYGWYGSYSNSNNWEYNSLMIDQGWVDKLLAKTVKGWNWTITQSSTPSCYIYDQSVEGWTNRNLYINLRV